MSKLRKICAWIVAYVRSYFAEDKPILQSHAVDPADAHLAVPIDFGKPVGDTLPCEDAVYVAAKERVLKLDREGGDFWRATFHGRYRNGDTLAAAAPLKSMLSILGITRDMYSLHEFGGTWVLIVTGDATTFHVIDATCKHFAPWLMYIAADRRAHIALHVIDHLYQQHRYICAETRDQLADTALAEKEYS